MGPASRFACAGQQRWICLSSLRAQRSNPWHVRKEDGLLRCARNDGGGDGWKKLKSVSSLRKQGPIRVRFERGCSMTSSQATPCGYGSRIALRLCGTTAVDLVCRHCERSEAIHWHIRKEGGLLRCARNDGVGTARKHPPL